MWHASTAVVDIAAWKIVPVAGLPRDVLRRLRQFGLKMLDGVGVGPWIHHELELAVHVRRRLSGAELAQLDAKWLAIPAIDMG